MTAVEHDDDTRPPHGTRRRYANHGCRCADCRAANAAWSRYYSGKGPRPPAEIQGGVASVTTLFRDKPTGWMGSANCIGVTPDIMFPTRGDSLSEHSSLVQAKAICASCVVRADCLEYALADPPEKFGIWGGTSEAERRRIRQSRRRRGA